MTPNNAPTTEAPLRGIRVVDVTRVLAGPFCTMLLGDHGAEVIKIEQPGRGDDTRHQANPRLGGENTAYLGVNRNKMSVTIDLRRPEGQWLARALIRQSDVFVENFRPGRAAEYGLGYEALRAENPRLIYASISGWGSDGPYANRAGYAMTAEAAGGLMSITGEPDRPPVKIGVSLIDNLTGLYAKDAITAALYVRERTGVGQKVECSLLESTLSVLSMSAAAYLMAGVVATRMGSEHEFVVPWKAFQASDGYFVVACSNHGQWVKLCEAIGRPELVEDERYRTMDLRAKNRRALYAVVDAIMAEKTVAEWLTIADQVGLSAAPVNTIDKVFTDPHVLHRQMVQYVDHPTLGKLPLVGHAQKMGATPLEMRLPPPLLGQHTDEVLRALVGLSEAKIGDLRERGVI